MAEGRADAFVADFTADFTADFGGDQGLASGFVLTLTPGFGAALATAAGRGLDLGFAQPGL